MAELSDEQIRQEDEFMKGLPRFNVGAFLIPFIWGPANGFWITILYYPAWLLADNLLYATYSEHSLMYGILGFSALALILGVSVVFAIVSQPLAAHRAEDMGVSREKYLKRQRMWAVVGVVIDVVVLALATYYNVVIRTEV